MEGTNSKASYTYSTEQMYTFIHKLEFYVD